MGWGGEGDDSHDPEDPDHSDRDSHHTCEHDAISFSAGHQFLYHAALASVVDLEERDMRDIWQDTATLQYLQAQISPDSESECKRVRKRAANYVWAAPGRKLFRKMPDASLKEVPHPDDRLAIIRRVHESNGHWGRRRTAHLTMMKYWFTNLFRDVKAVVQSCPSCSQTKATFNSLQPELHSLPIRGLNYRWSLDLAGPFNVSEKGYKWVLVAIEGFSRWVEVFPLRDKSASEVAYHVLHGIISRYGACAEIVTDGGGEFQGELEQLLVKCLIDHRVTSAAHPQANGLAERCVKSIKTCISRCVDATGQNGSWDMFIPWILMGYRVTPQEATKFIPYHLMYAVPPVIPPSIKERLDDPLSFDDIEAAAVSILQRSKAIESACIIAGRNSLIAQHRDSLRYAKLRSGGYLPQLAHFVPGQYVYVRDKAESIHNMARPEILRVQVVKPSGVLLLVGADGATITENAVNCAPCHLPIRADEVSAPPRPAKNAACEHCGFPSDDAVLLICDSCQRMWHTYCVGLGLTVPAQDQWFCQHCQDAGVDPHSGLTPQVTLQPQRAAANKDRPAPFARIAVITPTVRTAPGQKTSSIYTLLGVKPPGRTAKAKKAT